MTTPRHDVGKLRTKYLKVLENEPEISKSAMAKKLGIHPSTLTKYLTEWNAPPVDLSSGMDLESRPAPEPEAAAEPAKPKESIAPPAEPSATLADQLEFDPEWAYKKVKRWAGPRPAKEPKPPREKRFSESYPGAWNLARNLLPRLQVLLPMLILCYSALTETMKGNYAFYDDWARWLKLPQIMRVLSDIDLLQDTLMADGGYYLMLIIAGVLGIVLFYEFVWKCAFKEYRKKVYMREYKEGRCYWHDGNYLCRLFDRYYRSPPRETVRFYIRTHWWPPLNIFNPRASMLEITISQDERYFTRGNKLVVEEKPIRILTDHNKMVTRDGSYEGVPVPVQEARDELDSRQSELIKGTQKVTMANPHIRKETLRKSGIVASPEFIEEVRKAKEEKAGGA